MRATGLCFLEQSPGPLICPLQPKISLLLNLSPRTKKKVNQKYKSKKRITYRPSPATAPKFD